MDIDAARSLYLRQRAVAIGKRIPFRLTFAAWTTLVGDCIDQMGSRPGDFYIECIKKSDGYVDGNVRISRRGEK